VSSIFQHGAVARAARQEVAWRYEVRRDDRGGAAL
jgi:hypothetical protein